MGRGPGVEPADTRNDVVSKNICYPDAAAARISTLTLSFWGYAAMTAQPVTYMFERVDEPERRDRGFVPFLRAHEFVPLSLPTHQLLTHTHTRFPTAERGFVRDHISTQCNNMPQCSLAQTAAADMGQRRPYMRAGFVEPFGVRCAGQLTHLPNSLAIVADITRYGNFQLRTAQVSHSPADS